MFFTLWPSKSSGAIAPVAPVLTRALYGIYPGCQNLFDINLGFDEDKTLTHLTNPKNIHDAEKFCKIYPNGSLYDLDTDQKIG